MIKAKVLCCCSKLTAKEKQEDPIEAKIRFVVRGEKGDTGNGIAEIVMNDDYTLTVIYTDGGTYTTPIPIRGRDGEKGERGSGIVNTIWNNDGTITYQYDDGSTWTTPVPVKGDKGHKGDKGDDGVGISAIYLNPTTYTLTITYTNGQTYTTPSIRGEKGDTGDTGAGIKSTTWNSNGTITYTYDDGTTFTTGYLKGEKGDPGDDGQPGQNGVGIKSTTWNSNGTITYTYDDGTTFTTGYLKGEKGDPGGMSPEQQAQLDDATEKVTQLDAKVDKLELFKFPNANIVGSPLIENGNISRFSAADYLIFPFVVDVRSRPFTISMCFTTGSNITTQQNILDSYFGLALAIQNGKGIMALSSNGSSWDIGLVIGHINLQPNRTYYAKVSWDGTEYKTALSEDGVTYTDDMRASSNLGPYPTTMYIGASPNIFGAGSAHPFGGTINLNKCSLQVAGLDVWQGMDDAGLSTRADLSLSNLDAEGEGHFDYRYIREHQSLAGYATETFVSEEFARQLAAIDGNGVAY